MGYKNTINFRVFFTPLIPSRISIENELGGIKYEFIKATK